MCNNVTPFHSSTLTKTSCSFFALCIKTENTTNNLNSGNRQAGIPPPPALALYPSQLRIDAGHPNIFPLSSSRKVCNISYTWTQNWYEIQDSEARIKYLCLLKHSGRLAILNGMIIVPSRVHTAMKPIVLECNIFTQAYLDIPHFKTYHHTLLLVAPIRRKVAVEVGWAFLFASFDHMECSLRAVL